MERGCDHSIPGQARGRACDSSRLRNTLALPASDCRTHRISLFRDGGYRGGRARGRMLQLARSRNKLGSAHDGVDCGCGESGNNGSRRGSPWGSTRNRIRLRSTDSSATGTLVRTNWLENTRLIRARLADPRSAIAIHDMIMGQSDTALHSRRNSPMTPR